MKAAAKLADQDKGDNQQNPLYNHVEEHADNQHQSQRTQGKKKTVDAVFVKFHVTSRNGSCLQEPFCSDGSGPLDHLILLYRRRVSGALGWWIMPEDAVLAPTKSTAEKKNAVAPANLVINEPIPLNFNAKQFGKRVANRRAQEGLLQKELAIAIGVSNNHMSGIENGSAVFSFHVFLRLCLTLHVTPDYLLEGTTDSNNVPQSITDSLKLCSEADIKLAADFVDLLRERNI